MIGLETVLQLCFDNQVRYCVDDVTRVNRCCTSVSVACAATGSFHIDKGRNQKLKSPYKA